MELETISDVLRAPPYLDISFPSQYDLCDLLSVTTFLYQEEICLSTFAVAGIILPIGYR